MAMKTTGGAQRALEVATATLEISEASWEDNQRNAAVLEGAYQLAVDQVNTAQVAYMNDRVAVGGHMVGSDGWGRPAWRIGYSDCEANSGRQAGVYVMLDSGSPDQVERFHIVHLQTPLGDVVLASSVSAMRALAIGQDALHRRFDYDQHGAPPGLPSDLDERAALFSQELGVDIGDSDVLGEVLAGRMQASALLNHAIP